MSIDELKYQIENILDYRLVEMGVSLEYYKEEKSKVKQDEYWEDYDDYDYIVECCLEVLGDKQCQK